LSRKSDLFSQKNGLFATLAVILFNLAAMMYAHMGYGFPLAKLSCLVFLLGVILFLVWAIRTLDKKQLRQWVIGLLVVGLLGVLLSSFWGMKRWERDKDWKGMFEQVCTESHDDLETPEDWHDYMFEKMGMGRTIKFR